MSSMSSNSTSLPESRKRSAPSGTAKVAKVAKVAKTKDRFIVPDHEGEAFTLAPETSEFVRETHLAVRQHAEWEAEARKAEARDVPIDAAEAAPIIKADFWERMDDAAEAEAAEAEAAEAEAAEAEAAEAEAAEAEFVFDSTSDEFAFMCQFIKFPTPE